MANEGEPQIAQEQIDRLIAQIDKFERRRRIMLAGYLGAVVALILGQLGAFWVFVSAPPGTFVGWVFFVPFSLVGTILWAFGRWADRRR